MAVSGALVILLWMMIAATAPWIAPYDPIEQNVPIRRSLDEPIEVTHHNTTIRNDGDRKSVV